MKIHNKILNQISATKERNERYTTRTHERMIEKSHSVKRKYSVTGDTDKNDFAKKEMANGK